MAEVDLGDLVVLDTWSRFPDGRKVHVVLVFHEDGAIKGQIRGADPDELLMDLNSRP